MAQSFINSRCDAAVFAANKINFTKLSLKIYFESYKSRQLNKSFKSSIIYLIYYVLLAVKFHNRFALEVKWKTFGII